MNVAIFILCSAVLCIFGATICYLSTPLCKRLSYLVGAVDVPDGNRKIHTRPMPRLGGVGIFFAFSVGLLASLGAREPLCLALVASGALIVAAGVLDDSYNAPPRIKFILQAAAAAVAISAIGIPDELSLFGLFKLPLPSAAGFAFAIFRIVLSVNAVNFCDGLDGLACGLSSVALCSLFVFSLGTGEHASALAAITLLGAILGFIPYNKYPAGIYMGDCGSQMLGFSIALISLCARGGSFSIETSLFLGVPMLDTFLSVVRRLLKGKSPFSADKGHLHHLLLNKGFSHPQAVKILVSLSALIASAALVLNGKAIGLPALGG